MVGREILGSIKPVFATGTGDTVDTQNYEACMFVFTGASGSLTESDAAASGYTTVAAGDLITQTPPLGVGPWVVAYKGSKRYLRSGAAAIALLGNPRHVPIYDGSGGPVMR